MSEELKPCPFCGGTDLFVERLDYTACFVQCDSKVGESEACCMRGPIGVQESDDEEMPGHDAAVRAWNRRSLPANERAADQIAALKIAGTKLSNIAFNLAQRPNEPLSAKVFAVMDACRKEWDAAVCALKASPDRLVNEAPSFEWPTLPDLPNAMWKCANVGLFTEHQMQGYANAYGESVRIAMSRSRALIGKAE